MRTIQFVFLLVLAADQKKNETCYKNNVTQEEMTFEMSIRS